LRYGTHIKSARKKNQIYCFYSRFLRANRAKKVAKSNLEIYLAGTQICTLDMHVKKAAPRKYIKKYIYPER